MEYPLEIDKLKQVLNEATEALLAIHAQNVDGSKVYPWVIDDLSDRVGRRAELEAVLMRLPCAVLLAEPSGIVSYVNPIAAAFIATHPSLRVRAAENASRMLGGASVADEEVALADTDGKAAVFRVQVAPFEVDGFPRRALVLLEDITAASQARRTCERQQQLRETFVGILGHDLRTPLMAITSAAATLNASQAPEQVARASAAISRATARMTRLIDDMLDLTLSRIGGGIPLERVPTDLKHAVQSAIEEIEMMQPRRRIVLESIGDPNGMWDPSRLGQVITNLLSNAIEHGSGDAAVRVRIEGTSAGLVRFAVWNAGNPILPELLETIFNPFQRGDRGTQRRGGGMGLGLYIAERIVSAHGGTISVRSRAREGTTFSVALPRSTVRTD